MNKHEQLKMDFLELNELVLWLDDMIIVTEHDTENAKGYKLRDGLYYETDFNFEEHMDGNYNWNETSREIVFLEIKKDLDNNDYYTNLSEYHQMKTIYENKIELMKLDLIKEILK